eukprot:10170836-Lingulodinium_polyedra.AAC.1
MCAQGIACARRGVLNAMPAQGIPCIVCTMPCLPTRRRYCLSQAPTVHLHSHLSIEVFGSRGMSH